jgi:hypothetical protein
MSPGLQDITSQKVVLLGSAVQTSGEVNITLLVLRHACFFLFFLNLTPFISVPLECDTALPVGPMSFQEPASSIFRVEELGIEEK